MAKLVIDIEDQNKEKDMVLIYNGRCYTPISKTAFLRDEIVKLNKLSKDLESVLQRIENIENQLKYDHGEIEEDELGNN